MFISIVINKYNQILYSWQYVVIITSEYEETTCVVDMIYISTYFSFYIKSF